MKEKIRAKNISKYLVMTVIFLLAVIMTLSVLLVTQSRNSIISLMHTRMLDISNTAAAMIDGDVLETVTPEDEGTEGYETIMRTLTYYQDNIELKYIYCIRDMKDGTFTFGLDPTVEDPGEFGSPIVYTDALYQASQGIPSADYEYYEDAWGKFYSSYSPVFNSKGEVAGIIAVDFSAEWYDEQIAKLTRIAIIVAVLTLVLGGAIVIFIVIRSERKIENIHGQLNELTSTLMQEMGSSVEENKNDADAGDDEDVSMDGLKKQIQSMQTKLRGQIAQVHVQAFQDGLTGVKSKHAYLEMEKSFDEQLGSGTVSEFAVAVCDVNGLKKINDTLGHEAGDKHIKEACAMICDIFVHSPVYRIGGDEFVVILTGRDFENRIALMRELHDQSIDHITSQGVVVSGGIGDYDPDKDKLLKDVFNRADAAMYKEKLRLKNLGAVTRTEDGGREPDIDLDGILAISARKYILIADDEPISRGILGDLIEDEYNIYYAADGLETLKTLREHKDEIALVLLDLYMPNMNGREVMETMQVDENLMNIPVIVLTSDQDAELDCLKLGAVDFIAKPFPNIEIIKVRIAKCIELYENRNLIRQTQWDNLTGLLNIEYFSRYIERIDKQYSGISYDAVFCSISWRGAEGEQHQKQFTDRVLRSVGKGIKRLARKTGGIGSREGDSFYLYCPQRDDYENLFSRFKEDVFIEKETAGKVSLKFGVYENAQREAVIEERFNNAEKMAE